MPDQMRVSSDAGRFGDREFFWLLFTSLLSFALADIDHVIIEGNRFLFRSSGSEFFIRGIEYNAPRSSMKFADYLADAGTCERDIPWLLKLNANTIFVGGLDPSQDHTPCMNAFAAAGIYVVVRSSSESLVSWSYEHYEHFLGVIDNMAGYENTLGILAGTVAATPDLAKNATINNYALLRATVRDLKKHIREKKYRAIPVGLVSWADDPYIESYVVRYMTCSDEESQPEFILVVLKWSTGDSSFWCHDTNDISTILDIFPTVNLPILADIAICDLTANPTPGNPDLSQVDQTFVLKESALLSGGSFGEFFDNDWNQKLALVTLLNGTISPLSAFSVLASQISSLIPRTSISTERPTPTVTTCPTANSRWVIATTVLPPTPDIKSLCSCMMNTLKCGITAQGVEQVMQYSPNDWRVKISTLCEGSIFEHATKCTGIRSDPAFGYYGALSVCNQSEAFAWAANNYYKLHDNCDLFPDLTVMNKTPIPNNSDCAFLLDQVGEGGTGTVTAALRPSATSPLDISSPTGPSSPPSPPNPPSPRKALTTSVKAGIAVSIVGLSILVGIAVLWLRCRGRKAGIQLEAHYSPYEQSSLELDGSIGLVEAPENVSEAPVPSNMLIELPGDGTPRSK